MKTTARQILALLLFTLFLHSASADTPIRPGDFPDGLQGWWKFDGNATDASPNGYHLSNVNAPGYVPDDYFATGEQSGRQSGTNYWSIPDANCPNLSLVGSSFTISAWIKVESWNSFYNCIVRKRTPGFGFELYTVAGGYLAATIHLTTVETPTPVLSLKKWHHVAVVYDKAASVASLFVDGNLVHSQPHSIDVTDSAGSFDVGYLVGPPESPLNGAIKDFAVWNRSVTPLEIKSLAFGVDLQTLAYRSGNIPAGLVSWWKMDEISSGSSALDRMDSGPGGNHLMGTTGSGGGYATGSAVQLSGQTLSRPAANVSPSLKFNSAEQSFTVASWLYFNGNVGSSDSLFNLRAGNSVGILFLPHSPNYMEAIVGRAGVNVTLGSPNNSLKPGAWNHVALVYDAVADQLRIYIDGTLRASAAHAAGVDTSTFDLTIGRNANDYMNGRLSDLAVWNRALSATELSSLATGLPVQRSGVVSYWNLDEASGTRADSIGNNHLTPGASGAGGAAGVVGNAVQFTGANQQFLSITDALQSGLDIADDITVLYWAKLNTVSNQAVVYKRDGANNGWGVFINDGTTMSFDVNATSWVVATPQTLTSFFHAGLTFDGAGSRAFFNSVLNNSNPNAAYAVDNNQPFYVGSRGGTQFFFDGLMDEVIVARRWFRDEEIKAIYNNGLNGQPAFLPDTDGDGIPDEYETGTGVYVSPRNTGTNPASPDTDGDGLTDGQEVNTYHTNPNLADTDGDGFKDGFEISTGFDPNSAASTPESLSRILTAVEYRFNAASGVSYRIEASFDLQNWTTIETPIVGTGGEIARLYSIQGQPKRFFRSRRN